jgi:anti-sigma-K factor RskA
MNYNDPDILDALAAEYVVGTLRGASRRRFERLLAESEGARAAVSHWEALLGGLGKVLPEQPPPARVWDRIEAELSGRRTARSFWSSIRFWRVWGMGATAALLGLAVVLSVPQPTLISAGQVAVVENEDNQPMWVITANVTDGTIRARAVNAQAAAVDQAYELWMLPADGPPRSLGLLPVNGGVASHDIPPALLALLSNSQGLAISLEPAGGSPTGQPTGPVLFQAPIVEL